MVKYLLYYSNNCEHCKKILIKLARDKQLVDKISYICIDKRKKINGEIFIILENGKRMKLPKDLKEVPSLVMLENSNKIIVGDNINTHFEESVKATIMKDPKAFSITEMSGLSDSYSYLDMSTDELSAKGSGGTRLMHGYVGINSNDRIETPPEEETSNTAMSMEDIIKKRSEEINLNT